MLATHRVIGLQEWPGDAELTPEVLDILRTDVGHAPQLMVLSLRLPVAEVPRMEVLSADLNQLRVDLDELYTAMDG
jgi:hypothetical protein